MEGTAAGWYFSWIVRSDPAPRGIPRVDFHRTKYGPELLVDVIEVSQVPGFLCGGRAHSLAFYDILLVTRGTGTLTLDGRDYAVAAGRVFFTTPGQVRRWRVERLRGLCLFFTGEFVEQFFSDPLFLFRLPYFHAPAADHSLTLDPPACAGLRARLQAMRREIAGLRGDSEHALRAVLYELLVALGRRYTETRGWPRAAVSDPTALRLRQLVERHFREAHRPADYARLLRVTPGHLNALARRHLGETAGRLVRARLMLEAKRLLRHTDETAAAVGRALGFEDPAYFARFFKARAGRSPSAYRASGRRR